MQRIHVIDSHTAGEPTRLVIEGGPDLGTGTLTERAQRFRSDFDAYRSAIVNEPRGSDPLVGALLVKPHHPDCTLGVIFFNNVGLLGMCGHGTIGLIASLQHTGALEAGAINIDTPVGPISARLDDDGSISVANVASFRSAHRHAIEVPGIGRVVGDVAWGGNWFFLVSEHDQVIDLPHIETLTDYSWRIREAVNAQGHPLVDHVELFGAAQTPGAHSRNFVLCPGKAYDRSPCGTGTSAKLACLAADGAWPAGRPWLQESVIGSRFEGRWMPVDGRPGHVLPAIRGRAWITAEATLMRADDDPLRDGIRV